MNKFFLYILFSGIFGLFAQQGDGQKSSYKELQKEYKYIRNRQYIGPERTYASPVPMEDYEYEYDEEDYNGLKYSPQQIQQSRSQKNGSERGGSAGDKEADPEIQRLPPIDWDSPDLKIPDVQPPDTSVPLISPTFWKVLLIVLGFVLLAWIAYLIVKNYKPANKPAAGNFSPAEWNPELIPKTELELRLEAAMQQNDFRECVRIYFTFILKELIRLQKIKWKKDLTNIDYLIQMSGKDGYADFRESVRIYDLVWYGEYEINRNEYEQIVPHLEKNYKSLTAKHE